MKKFVNLTVLLFGLVMSASASMAQVVSPPDCSAATPEIITFAELQAAGPSFVVGDGETLCITAADTAQYNTGSPGLQIATGGTMYVAPGATFSFFGSLAVNGTALFDWNATDGSGTLNAAGTFGCGFRAPDSENANRMFQFAALPDSYANPLINAGALPLQLPFRNSPPATFDAITGAGNHGFLGSNICAFQPYVAPSPPNAFSCEANLYQIYTGQGQLATIDLVNNTLNNFPNSAGYSVNAIGYRTADNFIYGIRQGASRRVVRIDSTGAVTVLGSAVPGLPSITNQGDFAADGFLHVRSGSGAIMYRIDVTTQTIVSSYTLSTSLDNLSDIIFNPVTGLFYGLGQGTDNNLYSIDPTSGATQDLGSTGIGVNSSFGAAFGDASGALYFARNQNGDVYRITLPDTTAVRVGRGAPATTNDGAFCSGATFVPPSPSLELTKSADTSALSSPFAVGDTITYTFDVENTGDLTLDLGATPISDTMNLGADGSGASVTLTTGPTLVAASDPNGNGRLDVGETFQYTATFDLTQAAIDAGGVHNTASATGNPVDAAGNDIAGLADVTDTSDNDATGDGADGVDNSTGGTGDTTGDDNPTVVSLATPGPGPVPANPTAMCTMNWHRWETPTTVAQQVTDDAFNPTTYGATKITTSLGADMWYAPPTGAPTSFQNGVLDTVAPTENISRTQDEVFYGVGYYLAVPNSTRTFTFTDGGRFEGHAVAIFDSSGDQIARYPSAADVANGDFYVASGSNGGNANNAEGIQNPRSWSTTLSFTVPSDGEFYYHYIIVDEATRFQYGTTNLCPTPALELTKSADTSALSSPLAVGDTITYTFDVENTGDLTLDLGATPISDTMNLGADGSGPSVALTTGPTLVAASDPNGNGRLDVGETFQYTATFDLTQAAIDAGGVHNTASATGNPVDAAGNDILGAPDVTDTSDNDAAGDGTDGIDTSTGGTGDTTGDDNPTVVVLIAPSIALEKSVASIVDADGDNILSIGDTVVYSFTVINSGNTALSDVTINDAKGAVTGGPIDLAIGETDDTTFAMSYQVAAADITAGELVNTAFASGDAVDTAGAPIIDPITGGTLAVTDTSDTGTEPVIGADGTPDEITDPPGTESGTPDGDPGNDPTVLAIVIPELTVVKSVANAFDTNGDGLFGGEGDEIAYTFLVTNTGNVDLQGITLSDSLAVVSGGPIDLAVGQGDSLTFTASYTVVAADLARGYVENTASATGNAVDSAGTPLLGLDGAPITVTDVSDAGTDPDGDPVADPAGTESPDGTGGTDSEPGNDPTVLSVPGNPAPRLSVIKSVASLIDNGDGLFGAGDTVVYAFAVTNTGNVNLADVTVTDALATVSGGPISLAISVTDTTTFTATHIVTAAEASSGAIENTATATGGAVNSVGDPITEPGGGPQLTASDISDAGTESEIGNSGTPQPIADPEGNETPDASGGTDTDPTNDPTVLFIPMPGIEVTKSTAVVNDTNGDGLFGGLGDVIEYTFGVRNTGNTDLANVTLTDPTATVSGGPISLAIGASDFSSFTAVYTVVAADLTSGYVENTATAAGDAVAEDGAPLGNPFNPGIPLTVTDTSDTGTDPSGASVPDPENTETPDGAGASDGDPTNDPTVTSIPANPGPELSLIKSVAAAFDTDGDAVVGGEDDELLYQFDVTNTGNVALANVVVSDPKLGGIIATIPSLAVGATVSVTHSYIITPQNAADGFVENTAVATGDAVNSLGNPLLDPVTGDPITVTDDSDTGTDSSLGPIADPEFNETPDQSGSTDNDPTNDPTVTIVPISVPNTAIGGTFYLDENENGVLDGDDAPISGIIVQIRDADGNIIATTVTDSNGEYGMTGFPIGTHNVEFVDPVSGAIVGLIENLTFERNTVLGDQDGNLVPEAASDNLIVTKSTPLTSVLIGGSVPYVITVENIRTEPVDANIVDQLPPGFVYTPGTGTIGGIAIEPTVSGQTLTWSEVRIPAGGVVTLELVTRVGLNAPTGDLVNTARTFDPVTGDALSTPATATVRRSPEAVFQCSDIIGKVFDDVNRNGYQDGPFLPSSAAITDQTYYGDKYDPAKVAPPEMVLEPGLPGIRLITTGGLIITTDEYGRFNVPCVALPGAIGENFTLKVDDASLPTGYRMTTENPRTMRVTAGIMTEMNFGASIGHVVDIDLTAAAFTADHRPVVALADGLDGLLSQVRDTPSVLRISYFTNGESGEVAQARLDALEALVRDKWDNIGNYHLIIERTVARLQ